MPLTHVRRFVCRVLLFEGAQVFVSGQPRLPVKTENKVKKVWNVYSDRSGWFR